MLSDNQKKEIINRVKETIKLYLENKGEISDEQLANLLTLSKIKTSSSTVGRDLTGNIAKELLDEEVFQNIQNLRAKNKIRGNQKGGTNYSLNNNYTKDDTGKFTGSIRGRRV